MGPIPFPGPRPLTPVLSRPVWRRPGKARTGRRDVHNQRRSPPRVRRSSSLRALNTREARVIGNVAVYPRYWSEVLLARRPISEWPFADRPREKLLREGPHRLSDAELLAIILRLGTKGISAIDLGREIVRHFDGFRNMADVDAGEWRKIKGVGTAKTAQLIAAIEIGGRFWSEKNTPAVTVKSAEQVAGIFMPHLRDLKHEVFDILLLNGKRKTLGVVRLDEGTVTETSTYAREIMATALQKRAASVVLVHNHPSGDPRPSPADVELTRQAVFAGCVMNIRVQDHVIIGDNVFHSFADQGVIRRYEDEWSEVAGNKPPRGN